MTLWHFFHHKKLLFSAHFFCGKLRSNMDKLNQWYNATKTSFADTKNRNFRKIKKFTMFPFYKRNCFSLPKIQLYIQNLEERDKDSLRQVSVQLERIYYSLLSWELNTFNFQTVLNKVTCIREAVVHKGLKGNIYLHDIKI